MKDNIVDRPLASDEIKVLNRNGKRNRHDSESTYNPIVNGLQKPARETDERVIAGRMKQIQFGKNTIGYDNYLSMVPKEKRHWKSNVHPSTPDPTEVWYIVV